MFNFLSQHIARDFEATIQGRTLLLCKTGGGASETLYHSRDDAFLYIAYVMLIWGAPIPEQPLLDAPSQVCSIASCGPGYMLKLMLNLMYAKFYGEILTFSY